MASLEEQQQQQVEKMSLDQIRQVKEQVDSELSLLQDSVSNIRTATSRFEAAAKSVHTLSTSPPGNKPLSLSLSFHLCFRMSVCFFQLICALKVLMFQV